MASVEVAYAEPLQQWVVTVELPEGATVQDAIDKSGLAEKFPHLDLGKMKAGVFGKITPRDKEVHDGDRVELYRPIKADPKKVRAERAKAQAHKKQKH